MGGYIFEFTHGDKSVVMYRDDEGMYRVRICIRGEDHDRFFTVGTLDDRKDAVWLFNAKVQKLTSEWERTV